MKTAEEAQKLARVENTPVRVSENCDNALNAAVLKAIEEGSIKVEIALWFKDCSEKDETVRAYLHQAWYTDITVSHDYPGYNESYSGRTDIKFSF